MSNAPLSDSLRPHLGLALRILREKQNLSQKELALQAKVGKSQLSGYEKGRKTPNFESLLRVMAALDADFHDLHNAIKVASGELDQVCLGRSRSTLEQEAEEFLGRLGMALRRLCKALSE